MLNGLIPGLQERIASTETPKAVAYLAMKPTALAMHQGPATQPHVMHAWIVLEPSPPGPRATPRAHTVALRHGSSRFPKLHLATAPPATISSETMSRERAILTALSTASDCLRRSDHAAPGVGWARKLACTRLWCQPPTVGSRAAS